MCSQVAYRCIIYLGQCLRQRYRCKNNMHVILPQRKESLPVTQITVTIFHAHAHPHPHPNKTNKKRDCFGMENNLFHPKETHLYDNSADFPLSCKQTLHLRLRILLNVSSADTFVANTHKHNLWRWRPFSCQAAHFIRTDIQDRRFWRDLECLDRTGPESELSVSPLPHHFIAAAAVVVFLYPTIAPCNNPSL